MNRIDQARKASLPDFYPSFEGVGNYFPKKTQKHLRSGKGGLWEGVARNKAISGPELTVASEEIHPRLFFPPETGVLCKIWL